MTSRSDSYQHPATNYAAPCHHGFSAQVKVFALMMAGVWLYHILRIGIAALFIWSGVSKLLAPQAFVLVIEAFGLVAQGAIWPTAMALCLAEVAAGAGLLFDVKWSLGLITSLLVMFMAVLGYGVWLGLDVDCGCFGPGDPEGQAYHGLRPALYRDIWMLAAIGYLYFWRYWRALRPRGLLFLSKSQLQGGSIK